MDEFRGQPEGPTKPGDILRARKQAILTDWEREVCERLPVDQLPRPALLDDVPDLLDRIGELVDALADGLEPERPLAESRRHAMERLHAGFSLAEVVSEYAVLRVAVHRHWEAAQGALAPAWLRFVDMAIDDAVGVAVQRFSEARERQIRALDRISQVSLRARGLDDLLPGLLRVLREETPAVDTATILLLDDGRLFVRATAGLEDELEGGFSLAVGEGFAGRIAERREPLFLRHAAEDPRVESDVIRRHGVRALYGVPLVAEGELVGVIHMGSLTQDTFDEDDLRLFRALTARATSGIAQALLRERADQRLREIEVAYEALEHGDAVILLDDHWRFEYVNEAAESYLGRSREELLGEVIWDALPGAADPHTRFWSEYHRAMREQAALAFEEHYPPRDMWTSQTVYPRPEGGLTVFFRDVTERRRVEAQAQALQRLISVHPDFFYLFDREHRLTYVSPSLLALWGKSLDEAVGRTFEELGYPPDLVAMHRRQLDEALEGHVVREESDYTSPSGAFGHYEHIFVPLRDEDGEVEAVAGVARDVTERKQRELRSRLLAEVSARLAESLDVETTLADLPHLVVPALGETCAILLVREGRVVRHASHAANPEYTARARVHLARYAEDLEAQVGLSEVVRTGEPILIPEDVREHARAGSALRDVAIDLGLESYMAVPLRARGRVLGAISLGSTVPGRYGPDELALAREVADRAGLALDNARVYGELERALRSREDMLAIVSHDLRNPLGAVRMSATLLERDARLQEDERLQRRVSAIRRSSDRMERLLNDLVDMASLDAGQLSLEPEVQPLEPLLADAVELHDHLAREEGVALTADLALDGTHVACDRDRILQVLGNLLSNALKVCRPGDEVRVRARRRADEVVVSVTDTGPGIPPEDLPLLFEPYWTRRRRDRSGTGLGLYIARGIVEAHGGHLDVESTPGQGATFCFTLPVAGAPPRTG